LESEFKIARDVQYESVGLKNREIEQAVVGVFLHSQPVGQDAKTREMFILLGSCRPEKIDLEKGLTRWAQSSHWLDDQFIEGSHDRLPGTWRLGNRPNLTQMHAVATKNIPDDTVKARLVDDISKLKELTANASAAGARVHLLPQSPRDVTDNGKFSYVVLGPSAVSESGKPSAEAQRYLEETTGPDRPRVNKNAVLLLTPSKDGLEAALTSVRNYQAWETVREEIKKQQQDGHVDPVRAQTLHTHIEKAKGRIRDTVRHAYSIVVTLSEENKVQAFKLTVTDDPHFNTIKADHRSRIQDTAITAEALLPGGPYDLWRDGETSRSVNHLANAFAQFPHLPKMLKTSAIHDTLAEGCEKGTFVLRLLRPDRTYRTWWYERPDDASLNDPAMELVLSGSSVLTEIASGLLMPDFLPQLWSSDEIKVNDIYNYFSGGNILQLEREGYTEPMSIPQAEKPTIDRVIETAITEGKIWLIAGPSSIFGEAVPRGIIQADAILRTPPEPVLPATILPANLPDAWQDAQSGAKQATGLSIATALSSRFGNNLPWKTVSDAINDALRARFVEMEVGPQAWPCDFPSAQYVLLKTVSSDKRPQQEIIRNEPKTLTSSTELDTAQIQELGDIVSKLLDVKTKSRVPIRFFMQIEIGELGTPPPPDVVQKYNVLLRKIKEELQVK